MARWRSVLTALAVFGLAGALAGCSATPAPPGPTAAQLRVLVSRAEGIGDHGYDEYGVDLVRFITPKEWPKVMTSCVRTMGITTVDFVGVTPGPYTYPSDPEGNGALAIALSACGLEFPVDTMKPTLRTAAEWNYQYDYLIDEFVPCLRAAGATTSGIPARRAYVAAAESAAGVPSPYSYIASRVPGMPLSLLTSRCPSTAPGL